MSELAINDFHKAVIDEYFVNGFNQTQAVISVKQRAGEEMEYQQASNLGHLIINSKKNENYIGQKRIFQGLEAGITSVDILQELKNFAFADVTVFLDKTEEEIQQLPAHVKRALKKVVIKQKSYIQKDGTESSEVSTIYEVHDKMAVFEKIAKHIGFYAEDNKQKNPVMNLADATPEELNTILALIHRQKVNNDPLKHLDK